MAREEKKKSENKDSYNRKIFKRFFMITSILSACAAVLVMGVVVIQYNTNNMGLGEPSMRVDIYAGKESFNANIFEKEYEFKISDKTEKNLESILKAVPASFVVMGQVVDASRRLIEKILSLASFEGQLFVDIAMIR